MLVALLLVQEDGQVVEIAAEHPAVVERAVGTGDDRLLGLDHVLIFLADLGPGVGIRGELGVQGGEEVEGVDPVALIAGCGGGFLGQIGSILEGLVEVALGLLEPVELAEEQTSRVIGAAQVVAIGAVVRLALVESLQGGDRLAVVGLPPWRPRPGGFRYRPGGCRRGRGRRGRTGRCRARSRRRV